MAKSSTVHWGYWWLPGSDPEKEALQGSLTIGPDGDLALALVGGFPFVDKIRLKGKPTAYSFRPRGPYPVILGSCGSLDITLLDCSERSSSGAMPHELIQQTIAPSRAVVGDALLSGDDTEEILGLSMSIDYLLFFSRFYAFESGGASEEEVGKPTSWGRILSTASSNAEWRDISFELSLRISDFHASHSDPNTEELTGKQMGVLEIKFGEARTLRQVDVLAKKMQDLMTFAMNRPCAVRWVRYKVALPPPKTEWEERAASFSPDFNLAMHGRQIYQPDTSRYRDPQRDYFFTLADINLADLIPRWLDLYERASVGVQMLAGLRYLDAGYVSTRLTTVCIAVETLHYAMFGEKRHVEATEKKAAHDRKFTYAERAAGLADYLDTEAVKTLLGDPAVWVKMIKKSRNELAHVEGATDPLDLQYYLMAITQLLLSLVIGTKLGLPEERARSFTRLMWPTYTQWLRFSGQPKGGEGD